MDPLKEYSIPFKGIKDGPHQYDFKVDGRFFKSFENSLVSDGELTVELILDKRPDMMILDFDISGFVWNPCDRCLSDIPVPMHANSDLIVKLAEEPGEDEDIMYVTVQDSFLYLANYLYETIHLHLPIRNLRDCEADGYSYCDKEVLNKLEVNEDPNSENDSIWDQLRNIELND